MIAKITTRTDFSGIVNYANNTNEKSARIIDYNGVLLFNNETIADSFRAQLLITDENGKLHHLCKPVKHISVAFSPHNIERFPDNETGDEFMAQLALEWMQGMGINPENTQYIVVRHFDKQHPHCHIVFNRIANDGSVIKDGNERKRNEAVCRRIKERYNLKFGDPLSLAINSQRLRKYDSEKLFIRKCILNNLPAATNWNAFSQLLAQHNIAISVSSHAKTGHIQGVAFEHDGFRISGSKLGLHGKFTYGNLCQQLGYFNDNKPIAKFSGAIKHRNVIHVSIIRYIEIILPLSTALASNTYCRSENREYEVGMHSHNWMRIDDFIEEETTSYKFKL